MAFIQKTTVPLSFQGGLASKMDSFQTPPGSLLELENAAFDKIGQLNKRYGYDPLPTDIMGGNKITTAFAIDNFNNELNLFDNNNIYTYIDSNNTWANRGTAVSLINTNQQIIRTSAAQQLNPDSAYLNDISVYVWEDTRGGVRYSVLDRTTNSYAVADHIVSIAGAAPKTIVFNNLIYILYTDGTSNIFYKTINPSNPNLLTSQVNIIADGTSAVIYDATATAGKLYVTYSNASSKLTTISLDTSNVVAIEAERTTNVTTVSTTIDSTDQLWRIWGTASGVYADCWSIAGVVTSILSTVQLDTEPTTLITSIESLNIGSVQVVYEKNSPNTLINSIILKNNGAVTSIGELRSVGLCSKPFKFGSNNYLNVATQSALQSTYFTIQISSAPFPIIGKIAAGVGGGFRTNNTVAEINAITNGVFQFSNLIKGQFISENNTSFSLLGVSATKIDFTNTNKFNSVTQNNNLLFVGGILQSYDGVVVSEQNFHMFPEDIIAVPAGSDGALSVGQYEYQVVYSWTDKYGQVQYSTPSTPIIVTAALNNHVTLTIPTLRLTSKPNVIIKVYRTQVNQVVLQEVTSELAPLLNDPSIDSVVFTDYAADTEIAANAPIYTTGGVLANSAPPSCSLISLYQDRVIISGLEDPNLIWFSKNKFNSSNFNTIPVEFSSSNTLAISQTGGPITALGLMDDKLIIFKKSSIFVITGAGPNDTGGGDQFSPAELVTNSIGCNNANSVVLMKDGIMFQSDKGIWLLDRGLGAPQYIGAAVDDDAKSHIVSSATIDPNDNLVIFTTFNGKALVYDYYINQWSTWTNHQSIDAIAFNGLFTYCKSDGRVFRQNRTSFTDGADQIKMKLTTPWMSFAQMQGYQRVFRSYLLGNFKGPHTLDISVGYNFNPAFTQTASIDATAQAGSNVWGYDPNWGSSTPWGAAYQIYEFQINYKTQTCTSIRLSIEDSSSSNYNEGCTINSLSFELGILPEGNRLPKGNKVGTK